MKFTILAFNFFLLLSHYVFAKDTIQYGSNAIAGKYVQTSDARIYYEIYGAGEPLVLLHGGLFGYINEFEGLIPELSRNHLVIAIATRGHGKSELGFQPLTYRLLADDFAAVIRDITKQKVNVVGFSDGAIAGYHLAAEYPEIVKRFISVGGPLGLYGYTVKGVADLKNYDTPEELEKLAADFVAKRKKLMSAPENWSRFVENLARMWNQNEYISKEKIRSIRCPILIVGGDHDEYASTEHLVEIYRLLQKGQLAIVPDTGHTVFKSKPDLALKLIRDFFSSGGQASLPPFKLNSGERAFQPPFKLNSGGRASLPAV